MLPVAQRSLEKADVSLDRSSVALPQDVALRHYGALVSKHTETEPTTFETEIHENIIFLQDIGKNALSLIERKFTDK
jgi:hypothetical protein